MSEAGALAISIFNAGTFKPVRGNDLNFEDFDFTHSVNIDGVINGLIPAVDAMKEAKQGQIAIVSSVAGYGGFPRRFTYMLKFMNLWCYPVYFWLIRKITGG